MQRESGVVDRATAAALLASSPVADMWLDDTGRLQWLSSGAVGLLQDGGAAVGATLASLVAGEEQERVTAWLGGDLAAPCACRLAGREVLLYGRRLAPPVSGWRLTAVVAQPLEQDRRLRRLAAAIAHDFNNVLGAVGMFCQLLQGETVPTAAASFLGHLHTACRLGQNFTANLQLLSGRRTPRPAREALGRVVQGLESVLQGLLGDGFTLRLEIAASELPVVVDAGFVEQALLNLVKNAREAMPAGGVVAVRVERLDLSSPVAGVGGEVPAGTYMAIAVQDEGRGIAPALVDRVWELEFSSKETKAGVGLGLWVVRRIAELSGARLLLSSAEGEGTTVSLLFSPAV